MSKAEDILDKLRRSFNAPSTKDEKIKVVLICFALSTTFWFFNALNKNDYVTRINYPVAIEYDQTQYIATEPLPTRIPIEVSGGGWDLMTRSFGFKMKPVQIRIDRPTESGYLLTAGLRSEIMPELEPLSVNYFLSDTLRYKIERKVTREVFVQYDTAAVSLNENYIRSSDMVLSPSTITFTGPQSALEEIGDTLWLRKAIDDVSADFEDDIDLPQLPEWVEASTNSVQVSFLVVRMLSMDSELAVETRGFPQGYGPSPQKVRVRFNVPETAFDATDSLPMTVQARYREMSADSTIRLRIQVLNKAYRQVSAEPQTVKVTRNE